MGVRSGAGRAGDDLPFRVAQLLKCLVAQVGADGEDGALRARRAQPLELPDVEANSGNLEELCGRDWWIGGEDREAVGLGNVVDIVGGVEMRATRHLPQNGDRIARDEAPEMA